MFVAVASLVFVGAAYQLGRVCFAALAARARDRVLVFAGQAVHELHAAVSRARHGGGAGRRLAGGGRPDRRGRAVAARRRDRRLGRRIRHPLRLPGPRVRSGRRAEVDSRCGSAFATRCSCRASCTSSPSPASPGSPPWRISARCTSAGVGLVAVLLVYEQSLVSEHDLSQVKRAFDLNGYVGILYFAATAASLYVATERTHVRARDHRRQRRDLRDADDGGAAGAGLPPRGRDLGLREAPAARRARRQGVGRPPARVSRRDVRRRGEAGDLRGPQQQGPRRRRSRAAATTARRW